MKAFSRKKIAPAPKPSVTYAHALEIEVSLYIYCKCTPYIYLYTYIYITVLWCYVTAPRLLIGQNFRFSVNSLTLAERSKLLLDTQRMPKITPPPPPVTNSAPKY